MYNKHNDFYIQAYSKKDVIVLSTLFKKSACEYFIQEIKYCFQAP